MNRFVFFTLSLIGAILLAVGFVNTVGTSDWPAASSATCLGVGLWLFVVTVVIYAREGT